MSEEKAKLVLNVFNGTRRPISSDVNILVTLRDGTPKQIHRDHHHGPSIPFSVPFYDNFGDNYTVIAFADHYQQAGFHPVRVHKDTEQQIDLMLLPSRTSFNFSSASWDQLGANNAELRKLLEAGSVDSAAAEARYNQLMDVHPKCLACLLNISTAMAQVNLSDGTPFRYLKRLMWDGDFIRQDRFFAYADVALLAEVRRAANEGKFSREPLQNLLHPGATVSYKQDQFGEANLQLSFHEGDAVEIEGVNCMKVELDIDYYKDPLAHALLEVLPNHFRGPTDPITAYVLRWMAGRQAQLPPFEPPYTIEPAAL
jgi:hypothetical protein